MLESSEEQCRMCLQIAHWKEKRESHSCTSSHLPVVKDCPIRCLFYGIPVCTSVSATHLLQVSHTTMSEKTWSTEQKARRQIKLRRSQIPYVCEAGCYNNSWLKTWAKKTRTRHRSRPIQSCMYREATVLPWACSLEVWGSKAEYPYLCIEIVPEFSKLPKTAWSYAAYIPLHWHSLYSVISLAPYTVNFLPPIQAFSFLLLLSVALYFTCNQWEANLASSVWYILRKRTRYGNYS